MLSKSKLLKVFVVSLCVMLKSHLMVSKDNLHDLQRFVGHFVGYRLTVRNHFGGGFPETSPLLLPVWNKAI